MISDVDTKELLSMQANDGQVFETIIQRIYSRILRSGDNCIDGGAHNGLHTFPLARLVAPDGIVFAYEPVPAVADALEEALATHGIGNARVLRNALYHEHRHVKFKIVKNVTSRSGIERTSYPFVPEIEEIEVTTALIDDVLEEVPSLRFCKLDLEGGEFRALQGAWSSLDRHGPVVIFERSVAAPRWYNYTPRDFLEFFVALRYEVFDLFGRQLTLANWNDPSRPWYAVAVRSASADESLVRGALPVILKDLLERERSPVNSSIRPTLDGPIIWASPNPVPAGNDEGTTIIHWDTDDGSMGEVYLSVNGADEGLFFRAPSGSRAAPWINVWGTYEFRLYRAPERSELLATVTVTRRKG